MNAGKRRLQVSFMVFAMFFGAGNLIFPVFLAYSSGRNILQAFTGFSASAIGFPVLALIAIGKAGTLESIAGRVHPLFSRIFTLVIYLAIGPCLAIPRTASTSFEMVSAASGISSIAWSTAYSLLFFSAAAIIALHPEKLTKSLGRILAPILLLLILVLFAGTATIETQYGSIQEIYAVSPLAQGFRDGYQTMDAIAGLVFGSVLALNLASMGVEKERQQKEGIIASIGGGLILLAVYSVLVLIGIKSPAFIDSPSTGADILSAAAAVVSGQYGRILIAAIFIVACFNTSVGLLASCGEYFSHAFRFLSRTGWIMVFALASAVIANAGLEMIISISSPVLELIYPAAITMIVITFIPQSSKLHYAYVLGTAASLLASLFSMLGIALPLDGAGFGWVIPTLLFTAIGFAIDKKTLSGERA